METNCNHLLIAQTYRFLLTQLLVEIHSLLMTCHVLVDSDGSLVEACALLDSASSASFVSERLANIFNLPQTKHKAKRISGVAGLTHKSPTQSIAQFKIVKKLTWKEV